MKQTVAFHTLGCKLNFSESSSMTRMMKDDGFDVVPFQQKADVYVINTCSVTDNADKKCRYFIQKAKQNNPQSFILITGCYAQLKPKEIASLNGVDLVLGAAEKFNLVHHIQNFTRKEKGKYIAADIEETNFFVSSYSLDERTRAFLKIQDGCDYGCSFCTIPLARGKSRSDTIENVIAQANAIAERGKKEIVLTGVNIGDFGKGFLASQRKSETFYDLVQELDLVESIERFRISSIEPNLLSKEIIEFVAQSKRFMPHFHIPLQSGSDILLKKMQRRYLTALYTERIDWIRKFMPDACIGVDVIIGFPGETEEEFLKTYHYLNDLDVNYLHVFTYSERNNTKAIDLPGVVPKNVRKERSQMLRNLSLKKKQLFYRNHINETCQVLWEGQDKDGFMNGFTDQYIEVTTAFREELTNTITSVKLLDLDSSGAMNCEILEEHFVTK